MKRRSKTPGPALRPPPVLPDLPDDPLAAAFARLRRREALERQLAECRAALAGKPGSVDLLLTAADLLRKLERAGEGVPYLQQVLALDPKRADVRHMLAGLGAAPLPERADRTYVAALFDQMADSFDKTLVDMLDYKAPALVVAALAEALGPSPGPLSVIDLGCGTGLCGPLLRPLARRLDGVDLSAGMVAKARERRCYDDLKVGDIEAVLAGGPRYGAAVAADVLVYIGDLLPVFRAVAGALAPPGLFVFTIEHREGAPFGLAPSGRYSHSEAFVAEAAAAAGLAVLRNVPIVPRSEHGKPVDGRLCVLRK
jgi:predicted TPR repeat methyltransferase